MRAFIEALVSGKVTITVRVQSNFDTKWFQIALEHERAALEARARAVAAEDGSSEMGQAFDDELRAAMVAIAAAAFAIDALYVKVSGMLAPAEHPRFDEGVKRAGRIVETLKVALELGARAQHWQRAIPELFDLRDDLVHFEGQPYETEPQPTGKSNVSRESVIFTAGAATEAVDLALEVLSVTYSSPRKRHNALVKWAESAPHVPPWLEEERRNVG
jgi:hypothetical protein